MNYSSIFFLFPIGIRPLLAALPDLPGVRPLSLRRADLLTIELMQELNIVMPITWDVRTAFNDYFCTLLFKPATIHSTTLFKFLRGTLQYVNSNIIQATC